MFTSTTIRLPFTALFLSLLMLCFLLPQPVAAQELAVETTTNDYYNLKAKVAYLTAWVEALRERKLTPPPTFVTILDGDTVSLIGTLAQNPKPDMAEICGPMTKGALDWGDGTVGNIVGLGCAGDAQTFEVQHIFEETGSYVIKVTDLEQRSTTHVVAVNID